MSFAWTLVPLPLDMCVCGGGGARSQHDFVFFNHSPLNLDFPSNIEHRTISYDKKKKWFSQNISVIKTEKSSPRRRADV
jgi:hypothetical protein